MTGRIRILVLTLLAFSLVGCVKFGGGSSSAGLVRNKRIVLLRKGPNCYGAFIPTSQHIMPDKLKYRWYYRTDGKGTFKRSEAAEYKSGSGVGVDDSHVPWLMARFGELGVGWSCHQVGEGHVYYSKFSNDPVSLDDERICITKETNIEKIDATDPKWVYKASPADPGIRANGEKVSKP